jgi:hypothetical protein
MFIFSDGSVIEFTWQEVERLLDSFDKEKDPKFHKQIAQIAEKAKQRRDEVFNIPR